MRGVDEDFPQPASMTPSLREVFETEVGFVLRVLRRLGVAERDLDDAAQDVFVIVHRRLDSFDGQARSSAELSMRAWVFGIARRVAIARRRRAHARHEEFQSQLEGQLRAPDCQAQLEARALLERALAVLDAPKREVLFLYELEGMPMHEVAAAVDCPIQTAYSRLHAARALVRAELEQLLRRKTS
jgi:RNA polymerase sigma-70 factor (ECF subfamily)